MCGNNDFGNTIILSVQIIVTQLNQIILQKIVRIVSCCETCRNIFWSDTPLIGRFFKIRLRTLTRRDIEELCEMFYFKPIRKIITCY